jgi:hypothetical protein
MKLLTNSLIDKQHDSIYESFDLLDRSIEKFDSETTKISEELLNIQNDGCV